MVQKKITIETLAEMINEGFKTTPTKETSTELRTAGRH